MASKLQPDMERPNAYVLVVEDCPKACVSIRQALEHAGLHVSIAATPERGLELAARELFDLILLDLSSSTLRAVEFCQALRKESATRDTPIVFMVGWETSKETLDQIRKIGAADVITKPFRTLDFLARVLGSLRYNPCQSLSVQDWLRNR